MQNNQNFMQPTTSAGMDPLAALQSQIGQMTGTSSEPSLNQVMGLMSGLMAARSSGVPDRHFTGTDASRYPQGPGGVVPGLAGVAPGAQNVWQSAGDQRDASELYRQFQLPRRTPPLSSTAQPAFPSGQLGVDTGQPHLPPASTPDVSLLLAHAMSVPLATAFLQGMFAHVPPTPQPGVFPPAQANFLQMMQQVAAASQPSPTVVAQQRPPVIVSSSPAVVQPVSSPSVGSSSSASSTIQLPPMDTTVAKELLIQLVEQLQRAGQLPNDETYQRILCSVKSPSSAASLLVEPKPEIKSEPMENADDRPICVVSKTEGHSEPALDGDVVTSSGVYIDVAMNGPCRSESTNMDSDMLDNDGPDDESDNESTDNGCDERRKKAKTKTKTSKTLTKPKVAAKKMPSKQGTKKGTGKDVVPKTGAVESCSRERKATSEEESDSDVDVKARRSSSNSSSKCGRSHSDERSSVRGAGVRKPPQLKKCLVKLERIIVPKAEEDVKFVPSGKDRVSLLRQHKFAGSGVFLSSDKVKCETKVEVAEKKPDIRGAGRPVQTTVSNKTYLPVPKFEMQVVSNVTSAPSRQPSTGESVSAAVAGPVRADLPAVKRDQQAEGGGPSLTVAIRPNVNVSVGHQLRSMYMGFADDNMEWLSLVSCSRRGSEPSCQCVFCPMTSNTPKVIAEHIKGEHAELLFVLNKLKPSVGPLLYINCRHCDFVTVDSMLMWIHFDAYHGIPGIILDQASQPSAELLGPDLPARVVSLDDPVGSGTAFVCIDCKAVYADSDTTASAIMLAKHILLKHPDTCHRNGYFVRMSMLQKVESDNDVRDAVTYRQAIFDRRHLRGRRDVFFCVMCRYSAFCPYLALTHSLMTHQKKHLLYVCTVTNCCYQSKSDVDLIAHLTAKHNKDTASSSSLITSATLVINDGSDTIAHYCEYQISQNRSSKSLPPTLELDSHNKKAVGARDKAAPVNKSKQKKQKAVSDDGETDEENTKKRRGPKRKETKENEKRRGKEKTVSDVGRSDEESSKKRKRPRQNVTKDVVESHELSVVAINEKNSAKEKELNVDGGEESLAELQSTTVSSTNDQSAVQAGVVMSSSQSDVRNNTHQSTESVLTASANNGTNAATQPLRDPILDTFKELGSTEMEVDISGDQLKNVTNEGACVLPESPEAISVSSPTERNDDKESSQEASSEGQQTITDAVDSRADNSEGESDITLTGMAEHGAVVMSDSATLPEVGDGSDENRENSLCQPVGDPQPAVSPDEKMMDTLECTAAEATELAELSSELEVDPGIVLSSKTPAGKNPSDEEKAVMMSEENKLVSASTASSIVDSSSPVNVSSDIPTAGDVSTADP